MTPLFIATQGTLGMSQSQDSSMEIGMVRATQTRVFTPTQDLGKSQAFDWLNPSSQVCLVKRLLSSFYICSLLCSFFFLHFL